jgi:imidazolonepropionase-like amidohydrolase
MCNVPPRIALMLAAAGLLGLLAARLGSVGPLPKQVSDRAELQARAAPTPAATIDATGPSATLFKNVRVFDGKSDKLTASTSVLVVANKIEKIGGDIAAPEKATVIDADGRTLMPGLIDAHWHAMLVRPTLTEALTWDVGYANLVAGAEATDTLLRGFTTVRDVGGPAFGLKRAIDEGVVAGPRIYPSGAVITVTSGHGDFRHPFEVPRTLGSRRRAWSRAAVACSPTVRMRSACVCASSSCWAQPRSS